MRHRYQWYLLTQDPFPLNIFTAWEMCILYAEESLGGSRAEYDINHTVFNYVRGKEANIRNGFADGVLKSVEEWYEVNLSTVNKINTLVRGSNYAYTSFDLETKKVKGRFLHPGICAIIKGMLFKKRARGKPLGVRFVCELMMGDGPPAASQGSLSGLSAEVGAPVPLITLACTFVLHALKAIKAGNTLSCNKKTTKPLNMSESLYATNYRAGLASLQSYARLDKLRKAHMEMIMKSYLDIQSACNNNFGEHVEFDEEMVSDGE
ncbi:hypothetical protein FRC09_008467 [Ceratobasidium sp. 395]|nr:hypothetical protein FRC09_008467 [Ceratobasidium sp. 395]